MRFVCDVSEDNGNLVILALNPVTKTEVKISPPFRWEASEELEIFARNFDLYCNVSWQFGKLDPSKVNPSAWPRRSVIDALKFGEALPPPPSPPDRGERDAVTD